MTNSERLLLYTLPRWAGLTALSIKESLSDMWMAGVEAGHHADEPYDPDGSEQLRTELLKDFVKAPASEALGQRGKIQSVRDLDLAIRDLPQKPVPSTSEILAALLPKEELALLSQDHIASAMLGRAAGVKQHRRSHPKSGRWRTRRRSGK
jgi:hypothetical protein